MFVSAINQYCSKRAVAFTVSFHYPLSAANEKRHTYTRRDHILFTTTHRTIAQNANRIMHVAFGKRMLCMLERHIITFPFWHLFKYSMRTFQNKLDIINHLPLCLCAATTGDLVVSVTPNRAECIWSHWQSANVLLVCQCLWWTWLKRIRFPIDELRERSFHYWSILFSQHHRRRNRHPLLLSSLPLLATPNWPSDHFCQPFVSGYKNCIAKPFNLPTKMYS